MRGFRLGSAGLGVLTVGLREGGGGWVRTRVVQFRVSVVQVCVSGVKG